ncbi:MAG TPA: cytochrome-c peroxidase, partial [Burkholderiaceae bacterium]
MLLLGYALMLAACGGGGGTSDTATAQPAAPATPAAPTAQSIDAQLRSLLEQNHLTAPAKLVEPDALFNLGLNLFQSPLLSGNRKVSCSSCHPIGNAGLDNLPLGIGVNGSGSPPNRSGLPVLHRNTPSLINAMVGGRSFMFWDGRVGYQDGMFTTPAGDQLPTGLQSVVAAQALFPLLSRTEMLGDYDPADVNELAELNPPGAVVENNPRPVWNGIMARLRADATFSGLLQTAYPGVALEQMDIAFVGNALAAYQARRWYDFGATNELHGYIAGTNEISDSA